MEASASLFRELALAPGISLRNRVVMAPMTTWSADPALTISDEEDAYYRRRVKGVGLVITGCSHVSPSGIGFTDEFSADDDRYIPSLARLARAAKSGGARAVLQIYHAGNRALPSLVPGGEIVSASAVAGDASPFAACDVPPRALTHDEILEIIADFGHATRRAIEAGFDGVELHGAHSFLIQNFFSRRHNRRTDAWGGSLEARMRFPLAVVREVKRTIAEHADRPFVLGYRISPEEAAEHGLRLAEALTLVDALIEARVDYLHASLGSVLDSKPLDDPEGSPIAQQIAVHIAGRVPFIAAGQVRTPAQASSALSLGLSLIAVGQALIMNPDWVELAAGGEVHAIRQTLETSRLPELALPSKLWRVIDATTGWFAIERNAMAHGEQGEVAE